MKQRLSVTLKTLAQNLRMKYCHWQALAKLIWTPLKLKPLKLKLCLLFSIAIALNICFSVFFLMCCVLMLLMSLFAVFFFTGHCFIMNA